MAKCRYCEKEIDPKTAYKDPKRKNYWYCDTQCQIGYENAHKPKIKATKPKPKSESNQTDDYKDLMDYVFLIHNNFMPKQAPPQIKKLKDEGMTYKGIELALRYWVEILENGWDDDSSINIVRYCYDNAKSHWIRKHEISELAKNITEDRTIKVSIKADSSDRIKYKLRRENNDL